MCTDQARERTFPEVWCDAIDDLRRESIEKTGGEPMIDAQTVVPRVASIMQISRVSVRELSRWFGEDIEQLLAVRCEREELKPLDQMIWEAGQVRIAEQELRRLLKEVCPGRQRQVRRAFRKVQKLMDRMASYNDQEAAE